MNSSQNEYLIDTHAHLNKDDYDTDREAAIEAARTAGVKKIISVAYDSESAEINIKLAQKYKGEIFATYGLHPHHAAELTQAHLDRLKEAAKNKEIVAAGEIGLDYFKSEVEHDIQKDAFLKQLDIAVKYDMPVIIHVRDAFEDFQKLVADVKFRGVIHCYSGDETFAKWAIDKGFLISFTGSITYPLKTAYQKIKNTGAGVYEFLTDMNNRSLIPEQSIAILKSVPLDKIMVETDCPYLAPHPFRSKRNTPAYVKEVAECAAGILNIPFNEFCAATSRNAEKFFGI
ncbi:MAG: TatD family hydrolase [Candidatus Wallbacteria bacterium]